MSYHFQENIQRGILYLLKTDKTFFIQAINLIKPEYFEFPSHQLISRIIFEYHDKYKTLPNDEIIVELVKSAKGSKETLSDYTDELEYINKLDKSVYESPEFILDLTEKFARKRELRQALEKSVALMKNEDDFDSIEGLIRKALLVSRIQNVGHKYFTDVTSRWKLKIEEKNKDKFRTVFETTNKNLDGGLSRKELAFVAGSPGTGKSLYLVNQAAVALAEGRQVLYVSLEMSEDKIANRFDSIITGLPNSSLKESSYQLKLHDRLEKFSGKHPGARLIIKEFPTGTATVNSIRSLLVQLRNYEDFVPDLIIVDYLELLRPIRTTENEYRGQQNIAEELRGLAMEYNCLLWTATQTNRTGSKVAIITETELGDSFGKIRVADFAISLNQTIEEYEQSTMRIFVMKARDSKQRYVVPCNVNYTNLQMEEGNFKETDGLAGL